MEKLTLKCGRFMPARSLDPAERIRLIEAYLGKLTEELEYVVAEMDRVLNALETAYAERDGLTVVATDGEEG